jgi:hypothetical protein
VRKSFYNNIEILSKTKLYYRLSIIRFFFF